MRANHATKPQEPAPRGGVGVRSAIGRWLPHLRAVAAGGALLVQLWGFGAPGAYAASVDPLPAQAQPAVRRALHSGAVHAQPVHNGQAVQAGQPARDGQSAKRPGESGGAAAGEAADSPGLAGDLTGTGSDTGVTGATGTVGDVLQDRIRSGGLPLPGQRAAVPDAFALASGLLDPVPTQGRPTGTRASRDGEPAELRTPARPGTGTGRSAAPATSARPPGAASGESGESTVQEATAPDGPGAVGPATSSDQAGATTAVPAPPGTPAEPPETLTLADTATVTALDDGSATATAVLAPIAAGLLLTGAAMCKHRGLPRGH
ncbi:hypothetical protein ACIOJE_17220 [Kitasatospora sp. NPDC087861]|uniref:hypothetical protein n=1 Tax=Kitasatospora sp. NPDC087861 TaxID=3364070 RepID=UPI003802E474